VEPVARVWIGSSSRTGEPHPAQDHRCPTSNSEQADPAQQQEAVAEPVEVEVVQVELAAQREAPEVVQAAARRGVLVVVQGAAAPREVLVALQGELVVAPEAWAADR